MMRCFTLSLSSGQPWTKTPETTHQNDFLLLSLSYLTQSLAQSATAMSYTMAESQLKDSDTATVITYELLLDHKPPKTMSGKREQFFFKRKLATLSIFSIYT